MRLFVETAKKREVADSVRKYRSGNRRRGGCGLGGDCASPGQMWLYVVCGYGKRLANGWHCFFTFWFWVRTASEVIWGDIFGEGRASSMWVLSMGETP